MKRVAILVETALASGRSILAGISQYLHERDDWSVFHPTGYLGATEPGGLEEWEGDGIIARISGTRVLETLRLKNVPIVDVLGNVPACPFPIVKSDDRAIGRMAAEHFIEAGHHHFAFLGLEDERWSLEREEAFLKTVRQRAKSRASFHLNADEKRGGHWNENVQNTVNWLQGLPKPLALMVASDQFGPMTMKACQRLGLLMPEEISVVGVDNDQPFCDLCRPRLSSIEPDHVKVGYEAAKLLDGLISGDQGSTRQLETAPLTLHRRPSSDATAVDDPALVKALQYIRENACHGVSVDAVADEAGLSRSVLQRRFQEHMGRTVGDSLLAVKLRRARDMLTFTDLPLVEVAERSGFNYQEYLTYIFKKHLSTTPARYRAATRELS
jgi:LacI family transcriptional regulator